MEDILRLLKSIESKIDSLLSNKRETFTSESTSEISSAISKSYLEFPRIEINRQNPYLASGYSDLHEILSKIRPVLGKNGLHVLFTKQDIDGRTLLVTRIMHTTGEWIESRVFLKPSKNTIEAYGSNLNYMKRFELMDILGLTVSNDPFDDDGEADMDISRDIVEKGSSLKKLYTKKRDSYDTVTEDQYKELMFELDGFEDLAEEVLSSLQIRSFRELPKSRFLPTITRIRKIKDVRISGRK